MGVLTFLGGVVSWAAGQAGLLSMLPHTAQTVVSSLGAVLTVLGIRNTYTANPLTQALDGLGSGWKTATGVIVGFVGVLLSPDVFGALPDQVAHILETIGGVLAALGLYHAQVPPTINTKNEGAISGR